MKTQNTAIVYLCKDFILKRIILSSKLVVEELLGDVQPTCPK